MDANHLRFILDELQFSASMPSNVVEQLLDISSVQQLPTATVIFREGSVNRCMYLVRRGRIALEMNVPGRGTARILTIGPGEMLGWSSLLDTGKMTATAFAVEHSEVVVVAADKLRELSDTNGEFGYHLMRRVADALSKRLVATRLQLLDLFADAPAEITAGENIP